MTPRPTGERLAGSPPVNYERYFVPAIGEPVATDLLELAALQPGERVLDVACGTGVVTRMAAHDVGATGRVAGLDVNPGMLAVARASAARDAAIEWLEASAESMPLPDESYDVVTCQMGLQFVDDRAAALREMRRVLADDGRVVLNVPAPMSPAFAALADGMGHHIGESAAGFTRHVFALDDPEELTTLLRQAGFRDVQVDARTVALRLPAPGEFFWQYVSSTPLAEVVAAAPDADVAALEREVVGRWQELGSNGTAAEQGLLAARGRR